MRCKLCGCENIETIYHGLIRNGRLGQYTSNKVPLYQCKECNVIWHEKEEIEDIQDYYESKEYRNSLEGSSEAEDFYRLHDKETLDKFQYTGTEIFRNKTVADIGCGAGAFLDFLKGVAKTVIAVEPSITYREIMDKKGFTTYAYAENAKKEYAGNVDVITSFDVIEHVEDPKKFLEEVFELLAEDGQAIIGTPTDAPVMRELLGEDFEKKQLFSTQHLWIFGEKNLNWLASEVGFQDVKIKYFQRYGISNFIGWIREKSPRSDVKAGWLTESMNQVYKAEMEKQGLADYIVLYLKKS